LTGSSVHNGATPAMPCPLLERAPAIPAQLVPWPLSSAAFVLFRMKL
jgi:hypothetical protein